MTKNTFKILCLSAATVLAAGVASCSEEKLDETIFDPTEYPLDRTAYTFPLDTFVKKNFLEPYNLRYLYRMQDIGSDMNYNLVPCSYDQSVTLAVLCKYLWYDVYKKHVGDEFLKIYSPRIIHVIGSPAYNPTQGTMVLGTAEGGLKITLYNAEHLSPSNIDYMNEYFFKTMHHEFGHILNQRYNRPTDFDLISNGKYNAIDWNNTPDSVALSQGFVSNYASSQAREDWVEVIANYIVKDTITWRNMLNTAAWEWETADDVKVKHWDKINAEVERGRANRDSVGYMLEVSSYSNGDPETYKVQRKLIAMCRRHGKLCIVATQMMSSMVDNPEPTRAEVSDVATAVVQGADVVMLSDETANGSYPIETVRAMKKVILYTQNHSRVASITRDSDGDIYNAISATAVKLAEEIDADAIICQTASGATAFATAAERPNLPIVSVTSNPRVANQLALIYANSAFVRPYSDEFGLSLAEELKASGYLKCKEGKKDLLTVIVSGDKNKYGTDTIRVRKV